MIENFKKDEARMNFEISSRTSNEGFVNLEEKVYKVDVSGAAVSSAYSISLLHHYCSKLPHDEYDLIQIFCYLNHVFFSENSYFCKIV